MTQTISGYLASGDGKLYYEVSGEGEALVLVHAGFVDSRQWDDQWPVFAEHYRVIRLDMRGYGKSTPIGGPICQRDDLYQLLKHLGIGRAALLGCSIGGEVVLDFALEHPGMVTALILMSAVPGGFELQGEPPSHLLEMMAAVGQGDLALASELQNRIWVDGPFRQPEQVDPVLRQRAAVMNQIALKNKTWEMTDLHSINRLDPPAAGRLKEVKLPTLILAGGLDHPEILRAADAMTAAITGAQKAVLAGCAHLPNMEKVEEFNRAVVDFLTQA